MILNQEISPGIFTEDISDKLLHNNCTAPSAWICFIKFPDTKYSETRFVFIKTNSKWKEDKYLYYLPRSLECICNVFEMEMSFVKQNCAYRKEVKFYFPCHFVFPQRRHTFIYYSSVDWKFLNKNEIPLRKQLSSIFIHLRSRVGIKKFPLRSDVYTLRFQRVLRRAVSFSSNWALFHIMVITGNWDLFCTLWTRTAFANFNNYLASSDIQFKDTYS